MRRAETNSYSSSTKEKVCLSPQPHLLLLSLHHRPIPFPSPSSPHPLFLSLPHHRLNRTRIASSALP